MDGIATPIVTVAMGIVGVAILAVLVSQKSNTTGVLSAFGNAFSNMLSAATAPVTGSATAPSVSAITNNGGLGGFNIPSVASPFN